MEVGQKKEVVNLERTFDILTAQMASARRELASGGKVSQEGRDFHASLQGLANNKAWAVLCW